ncbi:hypothetical protein GJ496_005905 [Pomphorhynchus laevis]|nr:hypothetical protein GJ496_005905 [Pomphorhynchus laevis]
MLTNVKLQILDACICLFAISKVPELFDTMFIVLRKQKLIFLHWFHHATVLVYTWYAYHDWTATGRWFIMMNYTVHAFMYTYYAFRAMRFNIPRKLAMMVTAMQLSQMVVGCFVNAKVYRVKQADQYCNVSWANIQWSFLMYFVYFLLFCAFFFQSYIIIPSDKKKRSNISLKHDKKPMKSDENEGIKLAENQHDILHDKMKHHLSKRLNGFVDKPHMD